MNDIKQWFENATEENLRSNSTLEGLNRYANDICKYIPKEGVVLDIGCGNGNVTYRVSKKLKNTKIIGVDSSNHLIQDAKKTYPKNEWYNEDLLDGLHFKDNTFDTIYSFSFLQYFSPETYRILMKELGRILKPGGRIIHLSVPNKHNFWKYNIHNRNKKILSDFFTNRYNVADGSRWWRFTTAKKYVRDIFVVTMFDSDECWYRMDLMYIKISKTIRSYDSL